MTKETFCHGAHEGEACRRNGCAGIIVTPPPENCSCHINPPCGSCTEPRSYCPVCDWHEKDDVTAYMNGYVLKQDKEQLITSYRLRDLDNSKIDYHSKSHTNSSMIKEGVYPEGTSRKEVEDEVAGTFGGRFEYFGNGKFKYIAYTD